MKRPAWIVALFAAVISIAAAAQQKDSAPQLSETQKLGQRIYQQRCGVCHTIMSPAFPMYGPALYKDIIAGKEDGMRQIISEGIPKMPGFKYSLQPSEIDAIIEYLKTLPKPPKSTAPVNAPKGPMDL